MTRKALKAALGQRRKTVLATEQVCRTWVEQIAKPVRQTLKRPAAASASPMPLVVRRHAGLGGRLGSVSLSRATASAASSSASPKRPRALQSLVGYKDVDEQTGDKYRSEVSDKMPRPYHSLHAADPTELGVRSHQRGVPKMVEKIPYGRWRSRRWQFSCVRVVPTGPDAMVSHRRLGSHRIAEEISGDARRVC